MIYQRITSIEDRRFQELYTLLQSVFPKEEVLAYDLWKEPLEDPSIRIFVAIHEDEVVGTTEYRYYEQFQVAMTDFTIIGREGLGVGHFLATNRLQDLEQVATAANGQLLGMFAEIYNPYAVPDYQFGGIQAMNPFVRREVLSHLGYKRCDFPYVHPSWALDGEAVNGLDLCFLPMQYSQNSLSTQLITQFLETYYAVLPNKPASWQQMITQLKQLQQVCLVAI